MYNITFIIKKYKLKLKITEKYRFQKIDHNLHHT